MNISYTKVGDYLLPDLILENKKQYNIGKYGLLRLNYTNSAIDIFNCKCDISRLILKVKETLRIKYNLTIVKDNLMILKKYY